MGAHNEGGMVPELKRGAWGREGGLTCTRSISVRHKRHPMLSVYLESLDRGIPYLTYLYLYPIPYRLEPLLKLQWMLTAIQNCCQLVGSNSNFSLGSRPSAHHETQVPHCRLLELKKLVFSGPCNPHPTLCSRSLRPSAAPDSCGPRHF